MLAPATLDGMETYYGYVQTPDDVIKLFEACRVGLLPRLQRRLSAKERRAVRSGSVFVWDERETGMKRWTDGRSWSASRVSGNFLTYREMEGKGRGGPKETKADGLMKQSFSLTTAAAQRLHLISYYSRSPSRQAHLPQPTMDPTLRHVSPVKDVYPDFGRGETNQPPAHNQALTPQAASIVTHQEAYLPRYTRPCYSPAAQSTGDQLHPHHTSTHSSSHLSHSTHCEQPQALPSQTQLESLACPAYHNHSQQYRQLSSNHRDDEPHPVRDIQSVSDALASQLPSPCYARTYSARSKTASVSRENSTGLRRSRAGSPTPQSGLDSSSYVPQQRVLSASSELMSGSSKTTQSGPGHGDQLTPGMVSATVRYEETQYVRNELVATKKEVEILKQRMLELERQMQSRRP